MCNWYFSVLLIIAMEDAEELLSKCISRHLKNRIIVFLWVSYVTLENKYCFYLLELLTLIMSKSALQKYEGKQISQINVFSAGLY